MNRLAALGIGVLLTLSVTQARAQALESQEVAQRKSQPGANMTLTVDKTSVGVAERFRYVLVVEADADLNADFDGIGDRFGPFEVVERNPFGPIVLPDQRLRWQREYVLLPTDVGTAVLPSLSVAFLPSRNACVSADDCELSAHGRRSADYRAPRPAFILNTDPIDILVDTVLPPDVDLTRPRDVLAPLAIGSVQTEAGATDKSIWVLAALAAMMAVAFGFFRRGSAAPADEIPATANMDPAARALSALAALRKEGLPGLGRHDEHCSQLNHILRAYLDESFKISAHELTTRELSQAIGRHEQLQPKQPALVSLLTRTDLARFGHQYPAPSESLAMIAQAESLVEATVSRLAS